MDNFKRFAQKTSWKALLPALLIAPPGFASVRTNVVSRQFFTPAVVSTQVSNNAEDAQSAAKPVNVFSAFSNHALRANAQAAAELEPSAQTLAFLQAQGLLKPEAEVAASVSGDTLSRKEFSHAAELGHCHIFGAVYYSGTWLSINESMCVGAGGVFDAPSPYPLIKSSTITSQTATSLNAQVVATRASTVYAVLLPLTAVQPSSAQVIAGTDGSGVAAVQAKQVAVSNTGTLTFSDFPATDKYIVYVVARDSAQLVSPVVTQVNPNFSHAVIDTVGFWKFPKIRANSAGDFYLAQASNSLANNDLIRFRKWNGSGFSEYASFSAATLAVYGITWGNEYRVDFEPDANGGLHVVFSVYEGQMAYTADPFYGYFDGTTWSFDRIGESGGAVNNVDVFLDPNGKVHAAFQAANGAETPVFYATNKSGSWSMTQIAMAGSGTDEVHDMYVVADANSNATVVYRREDNQNDAHDNYYIATAVNNFSPTLLKTGKLDQKQYELAGFTIDTAGKLHYAYQNHTDATAFYVTNASGAWVETPVSVGNKTSSKLVDYTRVNNVNYFVNIDDLHTFFSSFDGATWVDGFDFKLNGLNSISTAVNAVTNKIMLVSESMQDWTISYHTGDIAGYLTAPVDSVVPIVNTAPVLAAIDDKSINEGSLLSFTATASDDMLPAGTLTFSLVDEPAGATIDPQSGQFNWTPSEAQGPNTYTFKVRVSDGELHDEQSITVTVNEVNVAPVLRGISNRTIAEEVLHAFTATATDADLPANSLTFSLVDPPTGASITPAGAFSWTPSEAQGPGSYTFTVRVSDGELYDEQSVTFAADERNVAPSLHAIGNKTVSEKTQLTFAATATDVDLPANTLTFSLVSPPTGASITPAGVFSWTPTEAQGPGSYTFTVRVSDGALTDEEEITVTVIDVNDAPSGADNTITINEDGSHTFFTGNFGFSDSNDSPANNFFAVRISSLPSEGDLTLNGNAVVFRQMIPAADIASGKLVFTPAANANGTGYSSFTFQVQDDGGTDDGGVDTDPSPNTITFNVIAVNDAPLISGTPATSVNQDTHYSFVPTVSDTDSYTLVFSIANKPSWASFSTTTGALTGTPGNADVGTTTGVAISVSDGGLSANLAAFDLTVINVNDSPTISVSGIPTSINQGEFYDFTPVSGDVDGDTLMFDSVNLPDWLTVESATGRIYGTPGQDDVGAYPFPSYVRVSDDGGVNWTWSVDFNLTVVNVNDAPVISGTPATSVNQNEAYSFIPTATDIDGDVLTFSITSKPSWASFDMATGALTGTPTNADVGTSTGIVISVSDGSLSASLVAFDLTVINTNDAPIVAQPIPNQSTLSGKPFSFQFAANTFNDIDVGDVLSYSATLSGGAALPSWLSFDADTRTFSGTPAHGDIGTLTIEMKAEDGNGGMATETFDLVVVLGNEAPVISGTPATQVDRGAAYRFVPTATDADGDELSFSATGLPAWLSVNTETGEVSGTAPVEAIGESYTIELTVSDGAESDSLSWNLSVVLQIGDITGLWLKDGELASERFGGSLALFDVTGDGRAEVYVGSPTRTVTVGGKKLKNAGGVDILAASNGELLRRVNAMIAKQRLGSALAVVADQNNDDVEDLIVGKPFAGAGGEIALHSGDDGSLIRTLIKGEGKAASPIVSIMPLCAIDPQHIVCRILGSSEQGGRIGYSVTVADVDGNGGADLIVGLPQANVKTPVKLNKAGSVIVYQGLTDTPRYVVNGTQAGERFGSSVAVDSDYLLVGSPNFDVQAAKKLKDAGRVQLFNLQDGSVAGAAEGTAVKQLFGSAVASFNQDVNADGQWDWAAAAAGDKSGNPIKLFTGVTAPVQFAEIAVTAPNKVDAIRLASGMDINGDGVSDLAIGLPNSKVQVPLNNKTKTLKNAGQVQVISGNNWAL